MKKKLFTDKQYKILKGNYTNIAHKHLVHPSYVKLIATGQRPVKSKTSKRIWADMLALIELLDKQTV